ncbi:MAG: WG repeat-containing protein [Candidatus Melainabacteria bacterium]|nr:WG repeat-containing protein [Candidatus Melainabacteria bacterium]
MISRTILLLVACFICFATPQQTYALNVPEEEIEFTGCDLFGLIDETGREVIKAKYARIEYERNGIFVVTEVNHKNKVKMQNSKRLFNFEGDELKFSLPDGARFVQLAYLGKEAQEDKNLNVMSLPEDALLVFVQNKKYGICFASGKIASPCDLEPGQRKHFFDSRGNLLRSWHTKEYAWIERALGELKPARKIVVIKR